MEMFCFNEAKYAYEIDFKDQKSWLKGKFLLNKAMFPYEIDF